MSRVQIPSPTPNLSNRKQSPSQFCLARPRRNLLHNDCTLALGTLPISKFPTMNLPDLRKSQMKLTARQKYDYRGLDRGEAQLIRVGHALWRDRRKLGDT